MTVADSQHYAAGASGVSAGQPLLSSKPLIHIGMHKTGSTWLQENLFGRDDTGFWSPSDISMSAKERVKTYTRALFLDHRGRLMPDEDFNPAGLRQQLEPFVVPTGRCAVFSSERLSGHPLSNGIDRGQLCDRVKQVFPNARILIVFREQRSMILSSYMQFLKYGGGYTLQYYIEGKRDENRHALTSHFFKYDRLIRLYQSAFGPENVLALPMEMFIEKPQDYVERICQFGNIDTPEYMPFHIKSNERATYLPYLALRRIAPLIRSSRGNAYNPSILGRNLGRSVQRRTVNLIRKVVPKSLDKWVMKRLQQQVEELTKNTYATSNRETEKLIGMDLGAFGYIV
jgi:hypothetical protein